MGGGKGLLPIGEEGLAGRRQQPRSGRHLSGAVAARACFRSTGADSGPSIGRSSLFLYTCGGVRVRRLPSLPPSLLARAKTPYTIPSNSFNYNKQFIRSIQDPPTATHASVWWGLARGVSGRGWMDGGGEGGEGGGQRRTRRKFASKLKLFRRWGVVVAAAGQTQLYPAQRNVFLVRSPVKRVGYARLGPDPGRPPSGRRQKRNIGVAD